MYMKYLDRQIQRDRKIRGYLGLGRDVGWVVIANECGISVWSNENVLEWDALMVVQLFEYTENHWIAHIKFWIVVCYVNEISKKYITLTSIVTFVYTNPVIEYLTIILWKRKLWPKKLSSHPEL